MATYYCYECDEEVGSAVAIMRSMNFEQVAFHRECWALYSGSAVPLPRTSPEDSPAHQSA